MYTTFKDDLNKIKGLAFSFIGAFGAVASVSLKASLCR
jgi:hypothetical protein